MTIVDLGNCQKVFFENLNFKEFFLYKENKFETFEIEENNF